MDIRDSNLERAERIYRFLLLLYPRGFRLRFGPEMVQIFLDIYPHDVRNLDFTARLAVWLWTVKDLWRSLAGEWWQALIAVQRTELPVRRWADLLVVPFVISGSLLVAGNLGATLVQSHIVLHGAHANGEAWNMALMNVTSAVVALLLGVLGILGAFIAAHSRRAESWIKL